MFVICYIHSYAIIHRSTIFFVCSQNICKMKIEYVHNVYQSCVFLNVYLQYMIIQFVF